MGDKSTVLIVEDDEALREAICDTLMLAGHEVLEASHGHMALGLTDNHAIDLIITDIQMKPMDGLSLLREIRRRDTDIPVVLITAYGSIESAVKAMREGATDYLVKPFEAEVLVSHISKWLATVKASRSSDMIAVDVVTRKVVELAKRVAATDAVVLITGESGVGKEVFFRLIHQHSNRREHQSVAINCAAIPENMLEAMLFGYEKGAFTGAYKSCPGKFEQAQNSTLLLDEISEMSLSLQAKLLRVLQERQVERLGSQSLIDLDVRIIATSNCDLKNAVRQGRFREDLFYRLSVFPLEVPPLRDRRDDIMPLTDYFLSVAAAANRDYAKERSFTPAAREKLLAYDWPGNVRELDNVVQRALIVANDAIIDADDLIIDFEPLRSIEANVPSSDADEDAESLGQDLKDHERHLIIGALEEGKGSRKFAAEKLGISPRTLRYKIARMRDQGMAIPGS